jgi:hypothetical protein
MVAPVEPEKFTSSNEKIVGLFTLPDPVFFIIELLLFLA